MTKTQMAERLSEFHLFSDLFPTQIALLTNKTKFLDVSRDAILFNQNKQAHGFYLLLKGQVKLGVESLDGSEKVIRLIQSGQSFGEESIFSDHTFSMYAYTVKDSQALLISKEAILDIIDTDVKLAGRMLSVFSTRNYQLVKDIKSICLQNSTKRITDYLLQINRTFRGSDCFRLPTNKTIIASMLNITPETFSRVMQKLQNAGLITVNGKDIVINNISGLHDFK
ncbi:MAG: Crp/Fnr family transcriptional regulator [Methylotenera sp.]|nr:MAG: Crp/Fnr family transcriptional regulator [Methylotenera sp.]